MDEEAIRKIVRDELWKEINLEGGVCDHMRTPALAMVQPIIDLRMRNLRGELGLSGLAQ